jgi:hypothetical protein
MARGNFHRELTAAACLPFVLVAVEGSVLAVLVRIMFEGAVDVRLLNYASGMLAIIPALANITSFVWVRVSHGRDKVRFITALQWVVVVSSVLIAAAPRTGLGLAMVLLTALTARAAWAGMLSVRSTVWKLNYPKRQRAQLTGRFARVQVALIAALSLGLGKAMDEYDFAYRVLLPIGAAIGAVGVWNWSRVRVRTHRRLLKEERETEPGAAPSFNPVKLLQVVRDDRAYDAFMASQFLLGLGNIMAMSLVAIVMRERFEADYFVSLLVSTAISLGVMPLAIPFWARLLDKTHIVHFRAIHSWVFVVALACIFFGAFYEILWLVFAYSVLKGIAFGGGALAWTLGHLDFAPPDKASLYGGVHVTLTGVRGLIAGIGGVTLYEGLETWSVGAGSYVFVFCWSMAVLGGLGFVLMSRRMIREGGRAPAERTGEVDPPSRANA